MFLGGIRMDIVVSNEIFIKEPAKEIVDYCKKELAISNPEFIKKEIYP